MNAKYILFDLQVMLPYSQHLTSTNLSLKCLLSFIDWRNGLCSLLGVNARLYVFLCLYFCFRMHLYLIF